VAREARTEAVKGLKWTWEVMEKKRTKMDEDEDGDEDEEKRRM
jgi:hypothetical protein